jgi:Kazal-type serine protease inhibitor domain
MKRILSLTTFLCLGLVAGLAIGASSAGCKPEKSHPGNGAGQGGASNDGKVCLCHIPPGNPANAHTICIGAPAVKAHLGHGDTLGPCGEICGGSTGRTCDADQFCRQEEGVCIEGAQGRCADVPPSCQAVFAPVCGCDGMTYDNACFADAARVSVSHDGPCGAAQACGAPGDAACPAGDFCKRSEGLCAPDARGLCVPEPQTCPTASDPVCGCDGHTHDNACLAAAAGVTVAAQGACPQACGGSTGVTCSVDQFCKTHVGECAQSAEGSCAPRPGECPGTIDRVCGCDGHTYDNACMAAAAGVNVASLGACATAKACGGESGATCDANQYCKADTGQCATGAAGVCTTTPMCCPSTTSPVCGCDGKTYDNDCLAAAAGVTIKSVGACTVMAR